MFPFQFWVQQAVATALGSPGPIVYMDVLATGSPRDIGGFSRTRCHSPSTPLLQYSRLLQDLTPVVHSGQQHLAASSCSQQPPKAVS